MTPLRLKMEEDLRLRNLAHSTQHAYVRCIAAFARHFGRSPAQLGAPEARGTGLAGQLLLAEALLEGGPGGLDLVGCGLVLLVALDSAASVAVVPGSVVQGAGPGLDHQPEHASGELAAVEGVEHDRGHHLLEEPEGALDVGTVLGSSLGAPDLQRLPQSIDDLVGVVAGAVVQKQGDRGRAGGGDTIDEGLGDRGPVLVVPEGHADEGAGVGVDVQLQVEREGHAVDGQRQRRAVA